MTHTPDFLIMMDDFNTMINVEELEPIDFEEQEMLFKSIFDDEVIEEDYIEFEMV